MTFGNEELLNYMRGHRLAVVGSSAADGAPQSAWVGIAVTAHHEVIFDTVNDSRKHVNLLRDARASVTFCGPDEQTCQLEGSARLLDHRGAVDADALKEYFIAWPDGRARLQWPKIAYWCVRPTWARYSDFAAGPLIQIFNFPPEDETMARRR
jgi:general stress protein 26